MNIGDQILTILLGMVIRSLVSYAVKMLKNMKEIFKNRIKNWPESWPEKQELVKILILLAPMLLLMFLAFELTYYLFGRPDPATPPVLEVTMFMILVFVGGAFYELLSFVGRKLKNWKSGPGMVK